MSQSIDVTGLPDPVVKDIQQLVMTIRVNLEKGAPAQQSQPEAEGSANWSASFQEWMTTVTRRADRYPPGFVVDDSRESIYEGRGE